MAGGGCYHLITGIDSNPTPDPSSATGRTDGANVTGLTECSCTWQRQKRGVTGWEKRSAERAFELAFESATTSLHPPRFRKNGSTIHHRHQLAPTIDAFRGNVGYWVIIAGSGSSFSVAGSFSNQLLLRKDNDENQGGPGTTRECNSSSAGVDVSRKIADTRISGLPQNWLHRFFRMSRRIVYHASPLFIISSGFVTIADIWSNKLFPLLRACKCF